MAEEWKILDYDRKDKLGQGGFGTVFKGKLRNNQNGIEVGVAIKRIEKARLDNNETEFKSVSRELTLKKLTHRNVVKLLLFDDQDEDFLYFALELCDASLDHVFLPENDLKKYRGPLPNDFDFMLQLSLGLEYIHRQNIVHRDIKPGNVLISSPLGGEVVMKWSDFGLSKATTAYGREYSVSGKRGTESYWAPEIHALKESDRLLNHHQADNDVEKPILLTIMSDVFACALVFFKFITRGVHPFGNTNEEIIKNICQANPTNLKELSYSHFSFNFLMKMMSNQMEERKNLREIIPLLLCLHQTLKIYPNQSIDEAYQKINKKKTELHNLCSLPYLNKNGIHKLSRIVMGDSVGLVNIVDENGSSPLLLLCQYNKSASLLPCIKGILMKNSHSRVREKDFLNVPCSLMLMNDLETSPTLGPSIVKVGLNSSWGRNIYFCPILPLLIKGGTETTFSLLLDLNYQDRQGRNALHVICMNYEGNLSLVFNYNNENFTHYTHDNLIDLVRLLMNDNEVDLNAHDFGGWTPLHLVCCHYTHNNLFDLIELLVKKGADVNAKTHEVQSSAQYLRQFRTLFGSNRTDKLKSVIDKDKACETDSGFTPLHILCRYYTHDNLIKLVQLLIDNGVNVSAKTQEGRSALQFLCFHYNSHNNKNLLINLVRLLIKKGADVNATDPDGWTAFLILCREYTHDNLMELALMFTENDVDVNAKTCDGLNALYFLCGYYSHDNLIYLVRLLIKKGVDVSVKDPEGWTLLHLLCRNYGNDNLIDLVQLLIENDIDVNAELVDDGLTALQFLCTNYTHNNLINLVRLLIEKGVDVNVKDPKGFTVLHLLCRHYGNDNLMDLVKLLIANGIDVKAETVNNRLTALHFLCMHYTHDNLIDLVRLMIEKGVDVNSSDEIAIQYHVCLKNNQSNPIHKIRSKYIELLGFDVI